MATWNERVSAQVRQDLFVLKNEDSTFIGAMEIDGSTDISGNLAVTGDISSSGVFIGTDISISGDMWVDGSADFSQVAVDGSVDISGALDCSVLVVDTSADFSSIWTDGSAEFGKEVACASDLAVVGDFSIDSTAVFGAKVIFEGDVSGAPVYTDRGDPAAQDYLIANLVDDTNWNDLDLGTDVPVPSDVKAVLLTVSALDGAASSQLKFRKNGNSNEEAITSLITQVANVWMVHTFVMSCDTNQIIEIETAPKPTDWDNIQIVALGWWT
jgi:cytoskeletal protein CcmA (bactofilin family)